MVKNDTGKGGARDIEKLDINNLSDGELELFEHFYVFLESLNKAIIDGVDLSVYTKKINSFIGDYIKDSAAEERYQGSVDVIRGQLTALGKLDTYARYLKTDNVKKQNELKQMILVVIEKWLN